MGVMLAALLPSAWWRRRQDAAQPWEKEATAREEEHVHPCRAGHRWHHAGPTASTCQLQRYDQDSGDLAYISPHDCPLCTGRDDLLIRGTHSHHCVPCEGNWTHEGKCPEGFFAWCPWCFTHPESTPAPGMRSGPHKHYCPQCSQTVEHRQACALPLRAVLPECPGCRILAPEPSREARSIEPLPSRPREGSRTLAYRVAVPVAILGGGLLVSVALVKEVRRLTLG